jgi:hypothetical protein
MGNVGSDDSVAHIVPARFFAYARLTPYDTIPPMPVTMEKRRRQM